MSILVTGGAGFIGSSLIDELIKINNENIVCLDNFNSFYDPEIKKKNTKNFSNKVKIIKGNICDIELLKNLKKEYKFNKIVHLAAWAGVRPSIKDPFIYEETNIKGTMNLLEISKEGIENFVFASSSSVYGINNKVPFSEDDKISYPISPYAATKAACELMAFTYHNLYKIPITCLRFFTVYGPKQRPEMAIHKFCRMIFNEETIPVFGDGTSTRDYTYIEDIVSGIINCINKPFKYEIINLGNSKLVKLKVLIELLEKNIGKKAKLEYLPMQLGDVPTTYANISKAKKLIDYDPKTPIENGIEKFVKWYKEILL